MRFEDRVKKLLNPREFLRLTTIGGHKRYHLEGNALEHTKMVVKEAEKKFGADHFMCMVALLHDIGKIYTSFCHGQDDWTYPNHSTIGAEDEYLSRFVDRKNPMYGVYKWYILNHIKPLFWMNAVNEGKELKPILEEILATVPITNKRFCTLENLRDLALCDIRGSISKVDQTNLIEYLKSIPLKGI